MRRDVAEQIGQTLDSSLPWLLLSVVTCLIPACNNDLASDPSANTAQTSEVPQSERYALPNKDSFELYLLIGQSNMSGRAEVTPEDQIPDSRIMMLDDSEHWVPAIDPVHTDKSAGVGLCRSFAQELVRNDESITIGLIPCALGGSPLERWERGEDLYKRAIQRTKNAMRHGRLRGILWHQGERDSRFEDMANTYGDRLEQMIIDIRRDLEATEIPVVVGSLGEFVLENPMYPYAEMINRALSQIPSRVSNTACVRSIGLGHLGDGLHFSREALEELGLKYAQAIIQLQQAETASPASKDR